MANDTGFPFSTAVNKGSLFKKWVLLYSDIFVSNTEYVDKPIINEDLIFAT